MALNAKIVLDVMTKTYIPPDNSVPEDPDYPVFDEADFEYERCLIVSNGDYIVDRDGRIEIVTSGNNGDYPNEFIERTNKPYLRARFLKNRDDAMEYANQIRLATPAEIKIAKEYESGDRIKIEVGGQVALL